MRVHEVCGYRYLNGAETLAYLAWSESAVDHPSVMIALLDDCLMELPKMQACSPPCLHQGRTLISGTVMAIF